MALGTSNLQRSPLPTRLGGGGLGPDPLLLPVETDFHWDASDISTMSTNMAGDPVTSDGDPVARWGVGVEALQANVLNLPSYHTDELNGRSSRHDTGNVRRDSVVP